MIDEKADIKMPVKSLLKQCQPMQLYIILALTVVFFAAELAVSHITHALTLLMDAYHMLCNIIALAGCIITIKHGGITNKDKEKDDKEPASVASSVGDVTAVDLNKCRDRKKHKVSRTHATQEKKLKNTFGWARIDVVFMLICCVFLASLCFSIFVEALQTLCHIDHQHEVHQPIFVLCVGASGLLLNGICYLLIGGYTFHQGSFLYVTESGDVVLDKVVTGDSVRMGERRLSRTRTFPPPANRQRQGIREMLRDVIGCLFVIVCGLATYFTDAEVAKYLDPVLASLSAASLLILSYPYMKESCFILLQTIPDTINIDHMKTQLMNSFPDIRNVHDLHVWQMTASKVISTVHINFDNPKVYTQIIKDVREFFLEYGITQVSIQPEFFDRNASVESLQSNVKLPLCLMKCQDPTCVDSHCCPTEKLQLAVSLSRETLTNGVSTTDLKDVRIDEVDEIPASNVEEEEVEVIEEERRDNETTEQNNCEETETAKTDDKDLSKMT